MDALYREQILEHYKHPQNFGHLDDPDLEFEDVNPLCGDELKVELKVDDDRKITDLAFSGQGCAISQASASMVSDEVKGMSVDELLKLDKQFVLELLAATGSDQQVRSAPTADPVRDARRAGQLLVRVRAVQHHARQRRALHLH